MSRSVVGCALKKPSFTSFGSFDRPLSADFLANALYRFVAILENFSNCDRSTAARTLMTTVEKSVYLPMLGGLLDVVFRIQNSGE